MNATKTLRDENSIVILFSPLFIPHERAVRLPPRNLTRAKKLGWSPAARKRPIGEG
ncbi:hypothetical protein [Bacillus toyonensis]|uniref:hypothetical protein n=1 Tax=Bacillus toyonensis TaxID=155322 RepID=UPI0015CF5862|nr:hypothetical protein [Bacillus toyonensis]